MTVHVKGLKVVLDRRRVLSEISMSVVPGTWLAVIGPNGAGKSTLLRAIAGLVPYGGEVRLGDRPAERMRPRERARLVAYAPQSPVMPQDMTVLEYVLLGRTPYIPYLGREGRRDRELTAAVLDRLDLPGFADRRLGHMSGGERQRVVIARALVQEASVLLLDEPTSALDLGHQQQVLELVDRLRLADELTVIMTMHDLTLAAQYADEMVLLSTGRAVAAGTPGQVLTEKSVAAYFGANVRITYGGDGRPLMSLVRPID